MKIYSPASFAELHDMLLKAVLDTEGPVAVRYPRGAEGEYTDSILADEVCLREGSDLTIVCYGVLVNEALAAARELSEKGISCEVIKLSRVDDIALPKTMESVKKTGHLLIAEDACAAGCVGKHLLAVCKERHIVLQDAALLNLGEGIVPHGTVEQLRSPYGLDSSGIAYAALTMLDRLDG